MTHITVGTTGDYAGWVEAYLFLVGLGALAEDYGIEQISDVTVNNNWPAGNIQLNGYTVTFYCFTANSHQGDPTKGFITYLTGALGYFHPLNNTSVYGSIIIDNLYFIQTGGNAVSLVRPGSNSALPRPEINVVLKNILIKGGPLSAAQGVVFDNSYINYYVSNVKIWDCEYGFWTTYSGTNLTNRVRMVENVDAYNCSDYGFAITGLPEAINIINCCAFNSGLRDWQGGHGAGITFLWNCADGDNSIADWISATETDCLASVDESIEFESLLDTNPDFLFLRKGFFAASPVVTPDRGFKPLRVRFLSGAEYGFPAGMRLYNTGLPPTLSAVDIAGKEYGQWGDYPIGCHNAEVIF